MFLVCCKVSGLMDIDSSPCLESNAKIVIIFNARKSAFNYLYQ